MSHMQTNWETSCLLTSFIAIISWTSWLLTSAKVLWLRKLRSKSFWNWERRVGKVPPSLSCLRILASSLHWPHDPPYLMQSILLNLCVNIHTIATRLRSLPLHPLHVVIVRRRCWYCSRTGRFHLSVVRCLILWPQLDTRTISVMKDRDICVVQLLEKTKWGWT